MEITCTDEDLAKTIQKLMERFYLPAKIIKRKNQFVVYMKAGEKIADFYVCVMHRMLYLNLKIHVFKEISTIKSHVWIIVKWPMK